MADWYIVSALVTLDGTDAPQQVLRIPTHDNEVRNHYHNLTAQGFRVIDVKVLPWYQEAVDVVYDQDETPTIEEVLDENTDTEQTTGSSD
jgi:hypothetical protein